MDDHRVLRGCDTAWMKSTHQENSTDNPIAQADTKKHLILSLGTLNQSDYSFRGGLWVNVFIAAARVDYDWESGAICFSTRAMPGTSASILEETTNRKIMSSAVV